MPTDIEAPLGSTAIFQCDPNAQVPSEATVIWFKDNTELSSYINQVNLTVSNVGYQDTGTYSCAVGFNGQTIMEAGELRIEGTPELLYSVSCQYQAGVK